MGSNIRNGREAKTRRQQAAAHRNNNKRSPQNQLAHARGINPQCREVVKLEIRLAGEAS